VTTGSILAGFGRRAIVTSLLQTAGTFLLFAAARISEQPLPPLASQPQLTSLAAASDRPSAATGG